MKFKQASKLGDQLGRRCFLGVLPVSVFALVGCRRPLTPHLFACNERDLHAIARQVGGEKIDPDDIQRNSAGSHVYIINSDRRSQKILVVPSRSTPTILVPPPGW